MRAYIAIVVVDKSGTGDTERREPGARRTDTCRDRPTLSNQRGVARRCVVPWRHVGTPPIRLPLEQLGRARVRDAAPVAGMIARAGVDANTSRWTRIGRPHPPRPLDRPGTGHADGVRRGRTRDVRRALSTVDVIVEGAMIRILVYTDISIFVYCWGYGTSPFIGADVHI